MDHALNWVSFVAMLVLPSICLWATVRSAKVEISFVKIYLCGLLFLVLLGVWSLINERDSDNSYINTDTAGIQHFQIMLLYILVIFVYVVGGILGIIVNAAERGGKQRGDN